MGEQRAIQLPPEFLAEDAARPVAAVGALEARRAQAGGPGGRETLTAPVLAGPAAGRTSARPDRPDVVSLSVRFDAPVAVRRGGRRGVVALGLVDLAVVWLRAAAVLILLSPVLAAVALLLG